jgi:hypothetical protein
VFNDSASESTFTARIWPWSNSRQSRFARTYFHQLLTEYGSLCTSHPVPLKEIEALDNGQSISWAKLHELEYLVLANVPLPVARRKVLILRQQVQAMASRAQCAVFAAIAVPDLGTATQEEVAAEANVLLSELQRLRGVRSEFERLRNRIYFYFMLVALVFLPSTGLFATLQHHYHFVVTSPSDSGGHFRLPIILVIATAGLLGAYFSVLLRLSKLEWSAEYSANYQQVDKMFWNVVSSMALAMMEGGVAAAVLYVLFMSGTVQGDLFPSFDVEGGRHMGFFGVAPKSAVDVAKALVWAVAAGFSERLVPDMLDSMSKRGLKSVQNARVEAQG